jgi:hypothetical protein
LTAITSGPKFPRSWRIRVSQIHCGSINKADQGCLQYFTGVNGRVKSFNFDPASGRQLSNQDYSICIRTERNFCSIQYTACTDPSGTNRSRSFTLSGDSNTRYTSQIGGGVSGQPNSCPNDWLMIPCAKNAGKFSSSTNCCNENFSSHYNMSLQGVEIFQLFSFIQNLKKC